MQINLRENLELINQIEEEFPVDTLQIDGVKIWPLIRLSFTQQAQRNSNWKAETGKIKDLWLKLSTILGEVYQTISDPKRSPRKLRKSEIVYLLATDKRIEKVDGAYFAKFADSFIHFVDQLQIDRQILEYSYDRKPKYPKYSQSTYVSHRLLPVYILTKIRAKLRANKFKIDAWEDFEAFMDSHTLRNRLKKHEYYISRYIGVLDFKHAFIKILDKTNPRFMVFMGLHSVVNFGLVLACRERNVKSVEMQHGQQGKFHNMYTHWRSLPKDGYAMLPSHFWMWGEPNAENINEWARQSGNHQAVIGGNTWMSFVKERKQNTPDSKARDEGIKKILVSCQLLEDLYESPIKEAILKGPDELQWFIRLHPSTLAKRDEVESYFSDCKHKNVDFHHANSSYIYDLLSEVDLNLTFWSTVAYEASAMGVPSVILHPNGKDGMSKYIKLGIFKYANNASELLEAIESANFTPETEPFIETNSEIIKNQILELIKS